MSDDVVRGRQPEVGWLIGVYVVGVVLAAIGAVGGVFRAMTSVERACTGDDAFNDGIAACHAYPHALEGSVIALFSILLGVLIVLAFEIAGRVQVQHPLDRSDGDA